MGFQDKNPEGGKSEFNEASLKMVRIAQLQNEANYFRTIRDNHNWFQALSSLFLEISSKLKDTEKNEGLETISSLSKKLRNLTQSSNIQEAGFRQEGPGYSPPTSQLFNFDVKIRRWIDTHGFGSPEGEDSLF